MFLLVQAPVLLLHQATDGGREGAAPVMTVQVVEQKARTFEEMPGRLSFVLFLQAGVSPVKKVQLPIYPKGF